MKDFLLQSDILEIIEYLGPAAKELEGKTVVLTGARGFLGRYFTEVFLHLNKEIFRKPCEVIALDNLITAGEAGAQIPGAAPGFKFLKHDVIEPFGPDFVNGHVDYILHCAGIASPYYYRAHPLKTLDVAVAGGRHMLDLAKNNGSRIVFFSSSEIYGDPDSMHVPTAESYRGNVACLGPRACYDESKRLGETLTYIYHNEFGVHTNIIRPFNVYGPGMQEKDYRVLPNFAHRIKQGSHLKVYGTGRQTRTFCYITDAIAGFLLAMIKGVPGEPYNIGNPTPELSMLELAQTIEAVLARKLDVDVIEYPDSYPADEPNRRCPDITKARLQLGYEPRVALEEGLKRFFGWSQRNYTGEE